MSRLHGFVCSPDFSLQKIPPILYQHFYSEGNDSISNCFSASLLRAAVADGPERQLRLLAVRCFCCTPLLALLPLILRESSASPSEQICRAGASICVSRTLSLLKDVSLDVEFRADHSLVFHLVDLSLPYLLP